MIPFDETYAQLIKIAPNDANTELLTGFCSRAAETLTVKLKSEAFSYESRVTMAAAALANWRYLQAMSISDAGISSMRAGDVTVSNKSSESINAARDFAVSAFSDAEEFFNDGEFVFSAI